ncbi:hypothetical protein [Amniculibacterium aquaticum]|uniref:hypothetical protein n=1 Tax=Amniculibacterium aquaticum TaxID=2479858 RepID=UPI0013DDE189|nr:hypothetical protein [Amniculibacterium aquaticum]
MSKIHKLFDKNYYAFSTIAIMIALTTFIFDLNNKNPTNKNEITNIHGKIEKFDYKPNSNQKYTYLIKIQNLNNHFQIPASYLSVFNKKGLELNANKNEIFSFQILKNDEQKLNKNSTVSVFGIYANSDIFLDFNKVIQINKNSKKINPFVSLFFFIAAIGFFLIRKFFWKPQTKHYR